MPQRKIPSTASPERFIPHCLLILLMFIGSSLGLAQTQWQNLDSSWLSEIMPAAASFSDKAGDPPVIRAYRSAAQEEVIGYVFTTPDVPPEELGFSGTIHMLIGMDLDGVLTGVKILHYDESYKSFRGDFIGESGIASGLSGKSVSDEFRLGVDVDAISRATISSWALARGARNAARRVAEIYLTESDFGIEASYEISALLEIEQKNWEALLAEGFIKEFSTAVDDNSVLSFSVMFMGHGRLGEMLIGARDYSNVERVLSERGVEGNLLLLGMRGSTARLQQRRLALAQGGKIYPSTESSILFAGTGNAGKLSGRASLAVAMVMDASVDPQQPFRVVYGAGPVGNEFASRDDVQYTMLPGLAEFLFGAADPAPNTATGLAKDDSGLGFAGLLALLVVGLTLLLVAGIHIKRKFTLR
jgi:NosR/NirI family nitrous oxide reductase transcriptional regulator